MQSTRRKYLLGVGVAVTGVGPAYAAIGTQQSEAIELIGRVGGWEGVAPAGIEGETNPTLELVAGTDYTLTWENGDGVPHDFRIRTAGGEDVVDSDDVGTQGETVTVEFTATEEMAEYYCSYHPGSMEGGVAVSGADTPTETETPTQTVEAPTASVTFEDQTTDGTSVEIASVTMSDGGFVTIHDSSLLDGAVLGSVVGVSEPLDAGTHEGIQVALFEGVPGAEFDQDALQEEETLIAMPHFDSNDNGTYDFVTSEGAEDGPYTDAEGAVIDDATVTLEDEMPGVDEGEFTACLLGENEVPPVDTEASGEAHFTVEQTEDQPEVSYELTVSGPWNGCVSQAHIHLGGADENGPVVAFLFDAGEDPVAEPEGTLAEGTLTADDLIGPLEGEDLSALVDEMNAGNSYVNVHSTAHPPGEIRGQIEPAS